MMPDEVAIVSQHTGRKKAPPIHRGRVGLLNHEKQIKRTLVRRPVDELLMGAQEAAGILHGQRGAHAKGVSKFG